MPLPEHYRCNLNNGTVLLNMHYHFTLSYTAKILENGYFKVLSRF